MYLKNQIVDTQLDMLMNFDKNFTLSKIAKRFGKKDLKTFKQLKLLNKFFQIAYISQPSNKSFLAISKSNCL